MAIVTLLVFTCDVAVAVTDCSVLGCEACVVAGTGCFWCTDEHSRCYPLVNGTLRMPPVGSTCSLGTELDCAHSLSAVLRSDIYSDVGRFPSPDDTRIFWLLPAMSWGALVWMFVTANIRYWKLEFHTLTAAEAAEIIEKAPNAQPPPIICNWHIANIFTAPGPEAQALADRKGCMRCVLPDPLVCVHAHTYWISNQWLFNSILLTLGLILGAWSHWILLSDQKDVTFAAALWYTSGPRVRGASYRDMCQSGTVNGLFQRSCLMLQFAGGTVTATGIFAILWFIVGRVAFYHRHGAAGPNNEHPEADAEIENRTPPPIPKLTRYAYGASMMAVSFTLAIWMSCGHTSLQGMFWNAIDMRDGFPVSSTPAPDVTFWMVVAVWIMNLPGCVILYRERQRALYMEAIAVRAAIEAAAVLGPGVIPPTPAGVVAAVSPTPAPAAPAPIGGAAGLPPPAAAAANLIRADGSTGPAALIGGEMHYDVIGAAGGAADVNDREPAIDDGKHAQHSPMDRNAPPPQRSPVMRPAASPDVAIVIDSPPTAGAAAVAPLIAPDKFDTGKSSGVELVQQPRAVVYLSSDPIEDDNKRDLPAPNAASSERSAHSSPVVSAAAVSAVADHSPRADVPVSQSAPIEPAGVVIEANEPPPAADPAPAPIAGAALQVPSRPVVYLSNDSLDDDDDLDAVNKPLTPANIAVSESTAPSDPSVAAAAEHSDEPPPSKKSVVLN